MGEGIFDEIGSRAPKSKGIAPAVFSSLANAAGGFLASAADRAINKASEKYPIARTLGVFVISVALRWGFPGSSTTDSIIRELAAGMAGWVGDDLCFDVLNLLGFGVPDFKVATPYRIGDKVRYQGTTWVANADIPASPQTEPGKDPSWLKYSDTAFTVKDLRAQAQAFLADEKLWNAIGEDLATSTAGEIERVTGTTLAPDELAAFRSRMRKSLTAVVDQVRQAA